MKKRISESISRFIPAHAGNTDCGLQTVIKVAVHPRACGEHWENTAGMDTVCGSSPRMRGTHRRGKATIGANRFIPAHAGNTLKLRTM